MSHESLLPPIVLEREYKDAVAASVSAIIVRDDGKISYATPNAELMFGCQCSKQLEGVSIDTLVSSLSHFEYEKIRDTFRAGSIPSSVGSGKLIRGKRLDGSEFNVVVGLAPVIIKSVQHIVCRFIQQFTE